MSISDERFELKMRGLEDLGFADEADQLRERDTAQREALARVEADNRQLQLIVNSHANMRDTAQAQLAEAVGLLEKVTSTTGWDHRDGPLLTLVHDFLVPHREAALVKAKGAQPGDERIALLERELDRERERADMAEVELQNALATQPAEWADQLYTQGFDAGAAASKRLNAVRGAEHE